MEKYNAIAWWRINKSCNINCPYCFQPKKDRNNSRDILLDVNKIVKKFDNSGMIWLVFLSGGEPFLHPNFIELCQELTKEHYIAIETNLSTSNVYDLCKTIDPGRVDFIRCSLHTLERERLNLTKDFIDKVKTLEKAGFNIIVTQVMWPPINNRYNSLFNDFEKENINILPSPFGGKYQGKDYPQSYTVKDREKIFSLIKNWEKLFDIAGPVKAPIILRGEVIALSNGYFSFKGLACCAGMRSIRIEPDGMIKRCDSEDTILGNLFQDPAITLLNKPRKCVANYCVCPNEGYISALGSPKQIKSSGYLNKLINLFNQ